MMLMMLISDDDDSAKGKGSKLSDDDDDSAGKGSKKPRWQGVGAFRSLIPAKAVE